MSAKSYPGGTVSAETAHALVAAISAAATEMQRNMTITVVDPAGVLKAFLRMDGAPLLTIKWSQDKAYTAAGFGMPTEAWYPMIKDDPALLASAPHGERVVMFAGGVPLILNGQLIGGVGVSGGASEEDAACARAGTAKLGFDAA